MSRQEKRLAELKPELEKQKEVVQKISKQVEIVKERMSKTASVLAKQDSNLKYQLKSESSAQSAVFGHIPSSRHISDRVAALRSQRRTTTDLTAVARKLRSKHLRATKAYEKLNKSLIDEQAILNVLNLEFKKLESSIQMSVKRREQRRQNKQNKQMKQG